jgi:hypothetical protein
MSSRIFALVLLFVLAARLPAAEITAQRSPQGVTVKIDGALFTEYLVRSGTKPILWPILGPTGRPVTRAYPMDKSGKETKDHVHQRSLWFTHGSVGGVDFWAETPPGKTGTIEHREFVTIQSGPQAVIVTRNDWRSPSGKKICEDERRLTFGASGSARWIDFDITLTASEGPVAFGDTKEGAFGLRVAESLRVESKQGGQIVNSLGQTDAAAWGKPAAWVDYHGPLDGQLVGIAVMNHPSSFRYPTPWHVRPYGLFAANPFGQASFAGKKEGGVSYTLPKGEKLTLNYRVLLHLGNHDEGKVAAAFADYAKMPK